MAPCWQGCPWTACKILQSSQPVPATAKSYMFGSPSTLQCLVHYHSSIDLSSGGHFDLTQANRLAGRSAPL